MTEKPPVKILIVEDELIVALNLSKELQALGFNVVGMTSSEDEAVDLAITHRPDAILMDINLASGGSGLTAAKRIREHSNMPIIYVTAYSSDKIIALVGSTNPYGYILKPYNIREVKAVVSTALVRYGYESKIQKSEQRLQVALKAAKLGVIEYDHANHRITLNEQTDSLATLGFSQEMDKSAFLALFSEKDAQQLNALLAEGNPFNRRARLRPLVCGTERYVDVYLSNVLFENEKVQIGAVQDVSNKQQDIEHLKISDSVLNQMQESVLVLDQQEMIKQVNPAFCKLIGYKREDLLKRSINEFLLHEREGDRSLSDELSSKLSQHHQRKVTVKRCDGSSLAAMMTVSDLILTDEMKQFVITLTDVSQLIEAQKSLRRIAFTDALTGFGNRAYLNRLLEQLYDANDTESIALLFIDIDSFKDVNDTLGHEAGDQVLIEFASRLKRVFRDKDYLVRLGGDEFVVILTGHFNKTSLSLIGSKIIALFDEDFQLGEQHLSVSCSAGIAFADFADSEPKTLLKQADAAMYQAKKRGKNTFAFFDKGMANQTQYRIFIEQGLKAAIKNKEIMIYLQPVVDTAGKIKSAEALCRWYNEETGFIPPDEFIPVAEESYLIQSLGLRVIHESMLAKKQINEAGFEHIVININFSEKQLRNADTALVMRELLEYYQLSACEFVLEITESTLLSSTSEKTIATLTEMGFKFALDDFGTGYSSLSRLHDYNVDIIKIDKSFTQMLGKNTKQNIITSAIIQLGKQLGYDIIAEGVESVQQQTALIEMGCDAMQGYLFAKPMPLHEFLRTLNR
jgi:diguanylate cyclase (GGDEF)-like protein/PAS domain S-box-containing protein